MVHNLYELLVCLLPVSSYAHMSWPLEVFYWCHDVPHKITISSYFGIIIAIRTWVQNYENIIEVVINQIFPHAECWSTLLYGLRWDPFSPSVFTQMLHVYWIESSYRFSIAISILKKPFLVTDKWSLHTEMSFAVKAVNLYKCCTWFTCRSFEINSRIPAQALETLGSQPHKHTYIHTRTLVTLFYWGLKAKPQ